MNANVDTEQPAQYDIHTSVYQLLGALGSHQREVVPADLVRDKHMHGAHRIVSHDALRVEG